MDSRRPPVWQLMLLIVVPLLVFSNSLHNEQHLDDHYRLEGNPGVETFWPPWRHFTDPSTMATLPRLVQFRPMLPLTLSVNHALAGHSLVGYHLGNLLFQITTTLLVFFLSRRLLLERTKHRDLVAFFAALLFAIHPVSGFLVNYISGRDLLLMQGFLCGSFLTYLRMQERGASPLRWALVLLLFLAALLSKINGVMLIAFIFLYEWILSRPTEAHQRLGKALRSVLPFLATAGAFWAYSRLSLQHSDASNVVPNTNWIQYAAEQGQHHVFHYFRNILYTLPIRESPLDPLSTTKMILGGCVVLGLVAAALYFRRKTPVLSFLTLAYFAALAPTSSVVPLHRSLVAYRPYIGLPFLLLAAVLLTTKGLGHRRQLTATILAALTAYFALVSHFVHNPTWQTEETLYQHSLRHGGDSRAHMSLALVLPISEEREALLRTAVELDPNDAAAQINLGLLEAETGRLEQGLRRVEQTVASVPNWPQAHRWHADILETANRPLDASAALDRAIELQPQLPLYRYLAAELKLRIEDYESALRYLEPLAKEHPGYQKTLFHTGFAHQMLGHRERAITLYRRSLEVRPEHHLTWYNLSWAHGRNQDWELAIEAAEETLKLAPDFLDGHEAHERWLRAAGRHDEADQVRQLLEAKSNQ